MRRHVVIRRDVTRALRDLTCLSKILHTHLERFSLRDITSLANDGMHAKASMVEGKRRPVPRGPVAMFVLRTI